MDRRTGAGRGADQSGEPDEGTAERRTLLNMPPPYNYPMALLDKLKSLLGLDGESNERSNGNDAGVTVERDTRETPATESEAAVKGTDDPAATDTDAGGSTGSMVDADAEPNEAAEPAEATGDVTDADHDPEAVADEGDESAGTTEDAAAAGTDAAASTGSMVDPEPDADEAAEPAEVTTDVADDADDGVVIEEAEAETVETSDEPVVTDTSAEISEAEGGVAEDAESEADAGTDDTSESAEPEPDDGTDASPSVDTLKGIGPAYADRLRSAGIETVAELSGADADALGDEIDVSPKRVARWIDRANRQ
jgi:predicted flap endonuclease-1-like 5' DNA nuclease